MVRLMGAALIAGGCAVLGYRAAAGLRARVQAVGQMAGGLALLEGELELSAPPLSQLMALAPGRTLFQDCAQGLTHLDREDFPSLWRRLTAERTELGAEGQAVLLPLGETLGRCGADRQLEALSSARRRLEALSARLEADGRRQGRVYQALGLSGGAFLVILLL